MAKYFENIFSLCRFSSKNFCKMTELNPRSLKTFIVFCHTYLMNTFHLHVCALSEISFYL